MQIYRDDAVRARITRGPFVAYAPSFSSQGYLLSSFAASMLLTQNVHLDLDLISMCPRNEQPAMSRCVRRLSVAALYHRRRCRVGLPMFRDQAHNTSILQHIAPSAIDK